LDADGIRPVAGPSGSPALPTAVAGSEERGQGAAGDTIEVPNGPGPRPRV